MILQQYIQEVLFKQRVCVVPQLGTFSVQHFPAHYNTHAQTLTAPRDQVMFTQQWQDDGSCVEWIALKENLIPAVAQRKLEKYLEELKADLRSGKPLVLPGIGQLQGDFAGNIHFHAEELPIEKETLDITPIERTDSRTPVAAFVPPPPTEALEPIMTEEVEDTLEAMTEESGFKWWWAAIPIAAIVIGLATWWYISSVSTAVSAPPVNMDSTTTQQMAAAADSIQQVLADSAAKAAAITPITYYAVLDSYKDSSIAVKKQKQQKSFGRELVVYKRDSLFRTAVTLHSLATDTTQLRDSVQKIFADKKVRLEF